MLLCELHRAFGAARGFANGQYQGAIGVQHVLLRPDRVQFRCGLDEQVLVGYPAAIFADVLLLACYITYPHMEAAHGAGREDGSLGAVLP